MISVAEARYDRFCKALQQTYEMRRRHYSDENYCIFWFNWEAPKRHGKTARLYGLIATPIHLGATGLNAYRIDPSRIRLWLQDRGLQ